MVDCKMSAGGYEMPASQGTPQFSEAFGKIPRDRGKARVHCDIGLRLLTNAQPWMSAVPGAQVRWLGVMV